MVLRRHHSFLLAAVVISTAVAALFAFSIQALASNVWSWHWPKNPGGGYERWIKYHDHSHSTIYPSTIGVNHNMAHYYNADNYVKPYRVDNSVYPQIDFYSGAYYASWYGRAVPDQTSGSHFTYVYVELDEADSISNSQKHSLICHEGGHSLGLSHQSATDSCMYPNDAYWPEDANAHDHATLKSAHNHVNE